MALPITGPFNSTVGGPTSDKAIYRTWHKQAKPFDRPLPYTMRTMSCSGSHTVFASCSGADTNSDYRAEGNSTSKAFSKLVSESRTGTTQLMTDFLERRSSMTMIEHRLLQLVAFAKALKKGDPRAVAAALKSPDPSRVRKTMRHSTSKSLANQWLELHFGWVPLVEDIQTAMKVLESPGGSSRIRSRAKSSFETAYLTTPSPGTYGARYRNTYTTSVQYGVEVRVSNPNLWLATQLGLVNPIAWAIEATPFSFVGDWFTNASQFLTAWDSFIGLELVDPYTTVYVENTFNSFFLAGEGYLGTLPANDWAKGVSVTRSLGISQPKFAVKPFRGFSATRAATAISLLIQMLPKR